MQVLRNVRYLHGAFLCRKVVSKGDDSDMGDAKFVLVTFDLLVRCTALREAVKARLFRCAKGHTLRAHQCAY